MNCRPHLETRVLALAKAEAEGLQVLPHGRQVWQGVLVHQIQQRVDDGIACSAPVFQPRMTIGNSLAVSA